jgi:hypothetical protein
MTVLFTTARPSRIGARNTEDVSYGAVSAVTGFPNGTQVGVICSGAFDHPVMHAFFYWWCSFIASKGAVSLPRTISFDDDAPFHRGETQVHINKGSKGASLCEDYLDLSIQR